jgi:protein-tyrosine phosphatase
MFYAVNIDKITDNIYVSNGPTAENEFYLKVHNFSIVINTASDLSEYFKKKINEYNDNLDREIIPYTISINLNPLKNSNYKSPFFTKPVVNPFITIKNEMSSHSKQIKYYDFGIKDNETTNLRPKMYIIARLINYYIIKYPNTKILVNCCMGLSRSVSMVAGYLILYKHMKPQQAIDFIKKKRKNAFTNPYFVEQLKKVKS